MVLFRSHTHPNHPGPALNDLAPSKNPTHQTQRRTRHLRNCEELGELGMDLARAAHREAVRDMQPKPIDRLRDIPGLPTPSPCRDSAFAHLFAELSRCVRQTMLLETRLAAGAYDAPYLPPAARPAQPATTPRPDDAAEAPNTDSHTSLYVERLEDEAAADSNRSPTEIIAGIAAQLSAALDTGLTPEPRPTAAPAEPATKPYRLPPPPDPLPLSTGERAALLYARAQTDPPPRRSGNRKKDSSFLKKRSKRLLFIAHDQAPTSSLTTES